MKTASAALHLSCESATGFLCLLRRVLSSLGIVSRSCGGYACQGREDEDSDCKSKVLRVHC